QPLRQLREHAARADDLLLGPGAREQLVDHLISKTIANLPRQPDRRRAQGRARSAGRSLRSPSGLAPRPADAIDQLGLGLRRHDVPFSSCLHRASDTPAARVEHARLMAISQLSMWVIGPAVQDSWGRGTVV